MPDQRCAVPSAGDSLPERYRKAARLHRDAALKSHNQCTGCKSFYDCNGGCPAWAMTSGVQNGRRFCISASSSETQPIRTAALSVSLLTLCALSHSGCHTTPPVASNQIIPDSASAELPTDTVTTDSTMEESESAPDTVAGTTGADNPPPETLTATPSAKAPAGNMNAWHNRPCMMSHIGCIDHEMPDLDSDE